MKDKNIDPVFVTGLLSAFLGLVLTLVLIILL
jgi:hypothetical protein